MNGKHLYFTILVATLEIHSDEQLWQVTRVEGSWTKFRVLILPQRKSLNALFCCCLRTQSCSTLFDPMDCSRPGSSVTGISQTRILGWVAISSPRDLPNPGTEPASPALAGEFFTTKPPGKPLIHLFFSFRVKKWGNHPSIFLI